MDADKALELATKAFPNDIEFRTAYMLGLNEGYELHKEDMMKEAVEGEVFADHFLTDSKLFIESDYLPDGKFHVSDKVKLVIIKED